MTPSFPMKKRLKCGTFKIDARGTKMGERFVRKIFDFAMPHDIQEVYVTIFDKHQGLIGLLERYGFKLCSRKTLRQKTVVKESILRILTGSRHQHQLMIIIL